VLTVPPVKFSSVVPSPDLLMGVKAVWGRDLAPFIGFGSRGDAKAKDAAFFSEARSTASRAAERPYIVTIGGGAGVQPDLRGKFVELLRATSVYGETAVFAGKDTGIAQILEQWPVSVMISETYTILGEPLLTDLGFPGNQLLTMSYDRVKRDEEDIVAVWEALKDREILRRWDIQPPSDFKDPGKLSRPGTFYPTLKSTGSEGKRVWELALKAERDQALVRAAKAFNKEKNWGRTNLRSL